MKMQEVLAAEALRLSEDMQKAREEELLLRAKDPSTHAIEFTVGDGSETALRAIVAARAFEGRLLGAVDNVTEALKDLPGDVVDGEGGPGALKLKGVSVDGLKAAIDYMYTGCVPVAADNVYPLLRIAKKLQLPGLSKICSCFLRSTECSASSVCKVLKAAHECEAEDLKDYCFSNVIDRDTKAAIESPSFEEMPRELLKELLQRPTLNVDELQLFKAVMRWGAKEKKRLEEAAAEASIAAPPDADAESESAPATAAAADMHTALKDVIDHVRFPLISPEVLQNDVQPTMQAEYGEAQIPERLILEAYQHHALIRIGHPSHIDTAKTTRRTGSSSLDAAAGRGHASPPAMDPEELKHARAAASRTYRWLQGLPSNAERLSMSGMQLSKNDAYVLAEYLGGRGGALTELDLKCNDLDRPSMGLILGALKNCPKLTGLALGENPLYRGAIDSVPGSLGKWLGAEVMASVPRLEKLGLGSTGLRDEDLKELGKLLNASSTLKVLGLSSNADVTRQGCESLLKALERERGKDAHPLHTLILTKCSLRPGDAQTLRALAPAGLELKT